MAAHLYFAFFGGFSLTIPRSLRLSLIAQPSDVSTSAGQAVESFRSNTSTDHAVNLPWDEHLDVVYRYALRLTRDVQQANDLAQETMLRGWAKRHKLREPQAARVWLLQIATNLWTDWQRSKRPTQILLDDTPCRSGPAGSRRLIQHEHVNLALATLDELPPRQRQVMHLITIEQMSHHEAATILEISTGTVKANLAAGRKAMREKLQDIYEEVCGERKCRTNK